MLKVIGDQVWEEPEFVHDLGDNENLHAEDHIFKGSFIRHRGIEIPLLKLRFWLYSSDAVPGYDLAQAFLGILFGLNCSFPPRDIALWVPWYLRGCKPIKIWHCPSHQAAKSLSARLKTWRKK